MRADRRLYSEVKNEPTARENGAEKWVHRKQQPTYADERDRGGEVGEKDAEGGRDRGDTASLVSGASQRARDCAGPGTWSAGGARGDWWTDALSLIHISEPTRRTPSSYA